MAGWMKTPPLGTEVDLGPGHIVLDEVPGPAKGAQQPPAFRPMSIVARVAHLSYCWALVQTERCGLCVASIVWPISISRVADMVTPECGRYGCGRYRPWPISLSPRGDDASKRRKLQEIHVVVGCICDQTAAVMILPSLMWHRNVLRCLVVTATIG